MDGIQPEGVNMKLGLPSKSVLQEKAPNFIRAFTVKINCGSPRSPIVLGKIGTKLLQIVPLGPEVVIDDIQHDGQLGLMTGIYEALQPGGPAIRVLHRIGENTIITPIARAWELGARHQFDGGDA